ncbi:MAG: SPOR domain-containing protein [Thermodesulfobacteriota bacterium]
MKLFAPVISILIIILFWGAGCTREEPSRAPSQKNSVVMPIKAPPSDEASAQPEEEPEMPLRAFGKEKDPGPLLTGDEIVPAAEPEDPGCYIVKDGESLSQIAARDEVYGDPLKWPILYYYNRDKIGELQLVDGFLSRELPRGEKLKVIADDELQDNLEQREEHVYVVNVLSARTQKRLIPTAIRLMREGYPVYLTSAVVDGKAWLRLRVGFFSTRLEAELERQKISDLLRIRNSWAARIEEEEFKEFGGY